MAYLFKEVQREKEKAISKLMYELNNDDSSHFDLMEAFKSCVLAHEWCPEEEFFGMLEDYPYLCEYKKYNN